MPAYPTRNVNTIGSPLTDVNANVLAGVKVTFILVDQRDIETSVTDVETGEIVTGSVSVVTNAAGEFSVDLWPNDRGKLKTRYRVVTVHPGVENALVGLPYGDGSPILYQSLIQLVNPLAGTSTSTFTEHVFNLDLLHPIFTADVPGFVPQTDAAPADATLRADGTWGGTSFIALADTPNDYVGQANKQVTVKPDATGLQFTDPGGAIDHNTLLNLTVGDVHTQYLNTARGDARYIQDGQVSAETDIAPGSGLFSAEFIGESSVTQHQGAIDHGSIGGTADDDHPQYHTDARGDARYIQHGQVDADADFAAGSGVIANEFISEGSVAQHQASLSLDAAQLTSGLLLNARVSEGNVTQHQAALSLLASQVPGVLIDIKYTEFTISGTWTPDAAMKYAFAIVQGGGGGGGGADSPTTNAASAGSGGSGGGCAFVLLTAAQVGPAESVTVGLNVGFETAGNASQLGTGGAIAQGDGGLPGSRGPDSTAEQRRDGVLGASGSISIGVGYVVRGTPGGSAWSLGANAISANSIAVSGEGGSSAMGAGGYSRSTRGNSTVAGVNGAEYGSGGSGGAATRTTGSSGFAAGGLGIAGVVRIWELLQS